MYWLLFLFTVFSAQAATQDLQITFFNSTIYYTEKSGTCQQCNPNRIPYPHYEDIPTDDGTSQITKMFSNPLPPGYMLKRIPFVHLTGAFMTSLHTTYSEISIFIGSTVIQQSQKLTDDFTTSCHNCHVMKNISSQYDPGDGWWADYSYHLNQNSFVINVLENAISLSTATIFFEGVNVNPNLEKIVPNAFPTNKVDDTGGIQIYASNLLPNLFTYNCETSGIINNTFQAIIIGPNIALCNLNFSSFGPTPPGSKMNLRFYPDTSGWARDLEWANNSIGPLDIEFYKQIEIFSVSPTSGDIMGNTMVNIYGSGFIGKLDKYLMCKFGVGTEPVQAKFINENTIQCLSTPGYMEQRVVILVTQNGESWAQNNSVIFTYKLTPLTPIVIPTPQGVNTYTIIICSAVFGTLTLIGVSYFIWMKIRNRLMYREIPDIDSSVIIDAVELELKERIGRGSFGDVYRAYWRYTEVAVKKIHNPSDALLSELYDEARLMITLRHPNIVTFMACTADKADVCIVTEYVERGSLYKILHDKSIILELDHLRRMALDACKGMAYLHGAHIIHRDLKSHNLLVDKNWNVKVADFGLSRALEETGTTSTLTACGTPCWTAPEVLRSQRYSFFADVYSFGICVWEMVTRDDPYSGTPPYQVVIAVATTNLRPTMPKNINKEFEQIIIKCWDETPSVRPTFGNLITTLNNMKLPKARNMPVVLVQTDKSSIRTEKNTRPSPLKKQQLNYASEIPKALTENETTINV